MQSPSLYTEQPIEVVVAVPVLSVVDEGTVIASALPISSPTSALSPASPVRRGRKHNWYAIKRSIHGRQLIVREWEDCEPNVKVRPIGGGDKIIPAGVWFKGFDTLDEAVAFLKA
jgi:hypothetical protein